MKHITTNILALCAVLSTVLLAAVSCNTEERKEILKVYNWGDYIDEELLPEFEAWYEEQTGQKVKVIYQTFDINEVMLAKIENGHADFDVVCPSEYIVERMMRNKLLLPILTPEFLEEINSKDINYFGCISPYIKEQFSMLEAPAGEDPNDYAVGYMWGTTGILYNAKYVTSEEAHSWDLMFDPRLKNKIFVKDAFRDVYSPMIIYAKTLEARERGELGEDEMLPKARENRHMLFSEAARLAAEAGGVKELWLTHFSPSLPNPKAYRDVARAIFPNTQVPRDGWVKTLQFAESE